MTRSKWDKENKRTKTHPPEYIGVVTHSGIIRKDQVTGIRGDYEYKNIALLYGVAERTVIPVLKEIYPTMWERIISYVIRGIYSPCP